MRYKDELRIAGVTALFCCAMLMITAVVPKDTTVAKARKTFKEAPETAADAEAQAQSEAEDAGFTVYTEDSNYDYEDNSYDDSGSDEIPVQILLTLILQALILQAILLTILLMTTAQLIIQRIM